MFASSDVSGVPGTGKTATVHRIVRELKRMAERNVRTGLYALMSLLRLAFTGSKPIYIRRNQWT